MASVKSYEHELPVSEWPEWKWFDSIDKLLGETLSNVQERNSSEVGTLYPFLDAIAESLATFRTLVNQLKLRDAYVIARVIYETSVNACFLLTDPEELSTRASTHAKQKALRTLIRAIELAGDQIFEFKPDHAEEILGHPQHQEWLREFTSRSGREIMSWTPENVQQRLESHIFKVRSRGNERFGVRAPPISPCFGNCTRHFIRDAILVGCHGAKQASHRSGRYG